jgi:hypothetical protein
MTFPVCEQVMGTARSFRIVIIQLERAALISPAWLVGFATLLLARTFTRQRLLGAATIARLQVEGVLLDILDDIFLLNLPLEAAKRALDRLAFLNFDFSQY